jgi:hypothetical protein
MGGISFSELLIAQPSLCARRLKVTPDPATRRGWNKPDGFRDPMRQKNALGFVRIVLLDRPQGFC